jgi:hypothetical protein
MSNVLRELAEHHLRVDKDVNPVKHPLWCFHDERSRAINEEITRLLVAMFIMEFVHPNFMATPILMLKKKVTQHMCID